MPSQSKLLGDLISAAGTVTVSGSNLVANTVANSAFQTGSVENYFNAQGLPIGRNRIINGAMEIDQRNAGASVTPTTDAQYTLDRWVNYLAQASKITVQQNAGSVTTPAGFTNYLGVTSSSAYSVGASDLFVVSQRVEGLNVADLAWGTANAATVTLSFWVRSSLTGTFGGSLKNSAGTRTYPFSYTISAANTWEKKSVTIAGDTSGTWLTTNGIGIDLNFGLGAGSGFSGTAGSWQAANLVSATGATSVVGTSGATFYITGVQLEQNTSATPFERRLYNQELANCQRYLPALNGLYWTTTGYAYSANNGIGFITFPVSARTAPTGITFSSLSHFTVANSTNTAYTPTGIVIDVGNPAGISIIWSTSTGLTSGTPTRMYASNASAQILFTGCEL